MARRGLLSQAIEDNVTGDFDIHAETVIGAAHDADLFFLEGMRHTIQRHVAHVQFPGVFDVAGYRRLDAEARPRQAWYGQEHVAPDGPLAGDGGDLAMA